MKFKMFMTGLLSNLGRLIFAVAVTMFLWFLLACAIHRNDIGKWGEMCKKDNSCNEGLICVYDFRGYNYTILHTPHRTSMCVDPKTMIIGW